ncbi:MAG TPA: DUF3592 domain-containing protein [Caulobacteraceae bacterium]|jgi:hypothetical protein|nr:DUF3592 domain-containing protein [Caulobacteraceae bacterium]
MTNLPLVRAVGLIFGACFAAAGLMGMRYGMTTLAWPSAPARIIISERVGMGDHAAGNIVAEFRLGEAIHHCGTVISGRDNSASDVRTYPVGRWIQVRYRPGDVGRCVFIPGISGGGVAFLLVGIAAFGLALYAHLSLRKR